MLGYGMSGKRSCSFEVRCTSGGNSYEVRVVSNVMKLKDKERDANSPD